MLRVLSYLILFLPLQSLSQLSLDFSDSSMNWLSHFTGDLEKFALAQNCLLSQSKLINDQFQISTLYTGTQSQECFIDLELDLNTSSKNKVNLFFWADTNRLEHILQAIEIEIGGSKDQITLSKWKQGIRTEVLWSMEDITEKARLQLKLKQDSGLLHCYYNTGEGYIHLGSTFVDQSFDGHFIYQIQQSSSSFFYKHKLYALYLGPPIVDNTPPYLSQSLILDSMVELVFSEPIDTTPLEILLNNSLADWSMTSALVVKVDLITGAATENSITISNLVDTSGNAAQDTSILFRTAESYHYKKGDILFNELLFDPYPDAQDFIELYNNGLNPVALNTLQIVRTKGETQTSVPIQSDLFLAPDGQIAITTDTTQLRTIYPSGELCQSNIPTMNNDEGILALYHGEQMLDSVHYFEAQHIALLKETEGVSLERVSHEGSSLAWSTWHSAASSTDFASPGLPNSQSQTSIKAHSFRLNAETITPNGDGQQDFLWLSYELSTNSNFLTAYVFSLEGLLVDRPWTNASTGSSGHLKYDLVTQEGWLLPNGHYILLIHSFNSYGQVLKKKIPFSVASQY